MRFSLAEVADITHGRVAAGEGVAGSFHTDSREVLPGGLFFALSGSARDGHDFVADAAARGAAGAVVEREVTDAELPQVVVADTWAALYALAGEVLRRVRPQVFGVTGSAGKTSTKEMLAAVLATRLVTASSRGNLNTETGLPLTVLALEPGVEALVLEMGVQKPGDMQRLVELARPTVGIVTGIGSVHVEFFGTVAAIAAEKAGLVAALPASGLAVLPAEDPFLDLLRSRARGRVLTFGLEAGDFRGEDYRATSSGGAFRIQGVEVQLSLGGRHQARNAVAALAAGEYAGVPLAVGARALRAVEVPHRLQRLPTGRGFELVDDTYNASPESMLAAFDWMADLSAPGPKLAVLGEMRELGELAAEAHRRVGRRAGEVFAAVCVVAGGAADQLAEAAGATLVPSKAAAAQWVLDTATPGAEVLVKASRGVGLEDVVEIVAGA